MKRNYLIMALIAVVMSGLTFAAYDYFKGDRVVEHIIEKPVSGKSQPAVTYESGATAAVDFRPTAKKVTPTVVLIEVKVPATNRSMTGQSPFDFFEDNDLFREFFRQQGQDNRRQRQNQKRQERYAMAKGSGVIISKDGYIVTNNHVIENAKEVKVTLEDNRTYNAEVIGTDPTTDLGLIKIKENDLSYLKMVNSDEIEIGEWVLAVGNPLSFSTTVTAGIVSAIGRNINIIGSQDRQRGAENYAIESFIQTDAAINKGNSGGALVNLNGDLVGINSAIASPTGYYSGYGFAIPTNIVNKVVDDLLKYGKVQRAVLGIRIYNLDGDIAKERKLKRTQGVVVDTIFRDGAAAASDLRKNDIITAIDGEKVSSTAELIGKVGIKRPGDKVTLDVYRDGRKKMIDVVLKSREGRSKVISREALKEEDFANYLGADFKSVDKATAEELDIEGGLEITKLKKTGLIYEDTEIKEGFIITKVDNKPVTKVADLEKIVKNSKGRGILVEGIYPNYPGTKLFALPLK